MVSLKRLIKNSTAVLAPMIGTALKKGKNAYLALSSLSYVRYTQPQ